MATPTASFPTAFPTELQLLNAGDRASTTLSAGIDSSTLTIPVASASSFRVPCLITIEDEQIPIGSKSGSNLIAISRGYAGTSAASHISGRTVRSQIGRWYHERLAVELKAVAEELADNRAYSFTCTSAVEFTGFNTTAGAQTITFSAPYRCPLGLAGAAYKHYVRVSNGVTSEVCLITGGTATSGGTGTLQFTTTNTYLGGTLVITSATAGIQEMVNAATAFGTTYGVARIADGLHLIYAAITHRGGYLTISGSGPGSTIVRMMTATQSGFNFEWTADAAYVMLRGLTIEGSSHTDGYAVLATAHRFFSVTDFAVVNAANGMRFYDCVAVYLGNGFIRGYKAGKIGILIDGATTGGDEYAFERVIMDSEIADTSVQPLAGIQIVTGGGFNFVNVTIIRSGYCIYINPGTGNEVRWGFITQSNVDTSVKGIVISPSGTGVFKSLLAVNFWAASHTEQGAFIAKTGSSTLEGVTFLGCRFFANVQDGAIIGNGAKHISFDSCRFAGNNTGHYSATLTAGINDSTLTIPVSELPTRSYPFAILIGTEQILITSGSGGNLTASTRGYASTAAASHSSSDAVSAADATYGGLSFIDSASDFAVEGCYIGEYDSFSQTHQQAIFIDTGSDRFLITRNHLNGNDTPITDGSTGTAKIIKDNIGINDQPAITVASAASVTLSPTSPGYPVFFISGNTPVTTINGGYLGAEIILIFTHATPAGVSTGGNITNAVAPAQWSPVRLIYQGDPASWFAR